jgi:ubiquinone/menaquinone biosynthesis C-methylase UbiE
MRAGDTAGTAPDDRLLAWGRRLGAARVLDIATDGNDTALAFAEFTPSVVAMGTIERRLHEARARATVQAPVRFLAGDVAALPFRDATFGVVTCRRAAHRFLELLPALRQVARVLRRAGSLLVEDVVGHDEPDVARRMADVERRRDPRHVRAFRHIEWTAFLRAAGMTVIDEAVTTEQRRWADWTDAMSEEARRDLERFVLDAPESLHTGLGVTVDADRIATVTATLVRIRADRD